MKYFATIKKAGFVKFVYGAVNELRKKIFIRKEIFFNKSSNKLSFSQYAEDLYLDRILSYKKFGFYVDIGANHPDYLSNTKRFYNQGWKGINIEPNSINFKYFEEHRPLDINLNIGISNTPGQLIFYSFEEDTLSTFSKEIADELKNSGGLITSKNYIETIRLADVLEINSCPHIDFMSIDTEGFDDEVIHSNDWHKFRPTVICIEDNKGNDFDKFFTEIGYKKICHNGLNSFFLDTKNYGKN